MVAFFRDKSGVAVFWLIILCFGLHVYSLINPPQLIVNPNEGFFYYLVSPFTNLQPYTLAMMYVILIFLTALQLNFVINDLKMLRKESYTVAAAFLLLSSLLPAFNQISTALLACNLLIWIMHGTCRLYNAPNPRPAIYNLGLLTGIAFILYYPLLPAVIIVLFGLVLMRSFRLNEWFVLIFGLLTPLYFLVAILFLKDNLRVLPLPEQLLNLTVPPLKELPVLITTLAAATAVVLVGIFTVQQDKRDVMQVRRSWSLVFVFLIFSIPGVLFIQHAWPTALLLVMVPASCYTGFTFSDSSRHILATISFWALLALSIYNNWFANY